MASKKTATQKPQSQKKRASADQSQKKTRCTVSEVLNVIAFAPNGKIALETLEQLQPSRAVLRETAKRLSDLDRNDDISVLVSHSEQRGFSLMPGDGGKKCPEPGETRVYSVQHSRRGPKIYIMLPVNSLAVPAGGRVTARFEEKQITVETSE